MFPFEPSLYGISSPSLKETTYGILSTGNSPVYFLDINKDDYIDIVWIDIVTKKILVSNLMK